MKEKIIKNVNNKKLTLSEIENNLQTLEINKQLDKSKTTSEDLQKKLCDLAFEKQKLIYDLQKSKELNFKVIKQLNSERDIFNNKTNNLQCEISSIKALLDETRHELKTTNEELKNNLRISSNTTMKLSLMFLRMKATKHQIDKKRFTYERLCREFIKYMKEQADIMRTIVDNKVANKPAACSHKQMLLINSLKRCSELLFDNANLRLKYEKKITDNLTKINYTKIIGNKHSRKYLKNYLCKRESAVKCNKVIKQKIINSKCPVHGIKQSISGSEITLFKQTFRQEKVIVKQHPLCINFYNERRRILRPRSNSI